MITIILIFCLVASNLSSCNKSSLLNCQTRNQFPSQGQQPATSASLLAQNGTSLSALSSQSKIIEPWAIDSGATDHMTSCASLFCSYKLSPGNLEIKIADGSFTTVAGTGTINISTCISLKDALHVPKLFCNLISDSKITRDLNCTA